MRNGVSTSKSLPSTTTRGFGCREFGLGGLDWVPGIHEFDHRENEIRRTERLVGFVVFVCEPPRTAPAKLEELHEPKGFRP